MDNLDFVRCSSLNNIPKRKLHEALKAIEDSADTLQNKSVKQIAINRYAESNIPLEYWTLKMERDFKGYNKLLTRYQEYIQNLEVTYAHGTSICFAGSHGVGKTMITTSILKKACQKGFLCQYSDMSNIVSVLTSYDSNEKFLAKRELSMVDFLVIDEMDSRFFTSESATELYAKNFESIFRTRTQNKLPTLICTNSPNLLESFTGSLKQSIGSLFSSKIEMFCVLAEDFRKIQDRSNK